ncbi:TPA: hypothetical protein NKB00_004379 [Vibrio parahaemolyticus]|nr:hypothetical protein [Vibrio parahaemolyticus]
MNIDSYFESLSLECEALKNRVRYFIDDAHWLTDGEWKESVLRTMISRSCPDTVSVGRGFLVTETGCSSQIDILLYDNSLPVLYRDGDLVFISPSACKAIIEVKSTYNAEVYQRAVSLVASNSKIVRDANPEHELFSGIFFYDGPERGERFTLEILRDLVGSDPNRTINHVCIGSHRFIKFWEFEPETQLPEHNSWHAYRLDNKAVGYFLHNLLSSLANYDLIRNNNIWFPPEGKAHNRLNVIARRV